MKYVMAALEGSELPDDWGHIHDGGPRLADFDSSTIADFLTSPGWFKFCVVRNPYARVFSAWKSKIAASWEKQYTWVQDEVRQRRGYPMRDGHAVGTVAFRDFVEWIVSTTDEHQRDGHWNLQVSILAIDLINYDFIGRFETFQEDIANVLGRVDAPLAAREAAIVVRNPTWQAPLAAAFDAWLADKVYDYYQADFEALGYHRDSWLFL